MRKIIFAISLFTISINILGQFYETGEVPVYQKYYQIKTEHFKLVFPKGMDAYANRMANMMELSYPHITKSLGHQPKRIPVLLNNTSVLANGYVVWAPKRMEVVTTPSSGVYSHDWQKELVLHETRHVVQVSKMNQGITKVLGVGFGQMITGGVTGMLPFWFLEGDAVCSETTLSESGRGRDPSFQRGLRTILLEKDKRFSYEKAYYGSYKDYIPDHYELGYQLTSFARKEYGNNIWDNVLDNVGRRPYQIYPFYFGLKKYASSSKVDLYNQTMDYLEKEWGQIDSEIKVNQYTPINRTNKRVYTSYRQPIAMDNSFFIVEKSSLDDIQQFVIVDNKGNERTLHTPGYTLYNTLSYASGKIVWDEIEYDPMWPKKSFNVIKIFDMATSLERNLTKRTRYFHPDISFNGKMIVCTENDELNQNYLVFLNAETGDQIKHVPIPGNKLPQNPRWDEKAQKVVLTLLGDNGKSIEIFDYVSDEWGQLMKPTFTIISKPRFFKNTVLFNAAFSGTDNIYSLDIDTKEVYQITNSRFGAYDAFMLPNENQFVYSDYTSNGYNIQVAEYTPENWVPLNLIENKEIELYEKISEQEDWKLEPEDIPENEFEVKPYSKLAHLVNIHSWTPFYFDYDELHFSNPGIYPGAQLFFQNLLSTSIGSVGYSYHDNNHFFNVTYDYKGTRPAIRYTMEYGGDVATRSPFDSVPNTNSSRISNNIRLYFPIALTNNRYSERFTPFVEAKFDNSQYFNFVDREYDQNLNFVEYGMLYYRLLKLSHRDIRSKFGQIFQLNYITSPNDKGNYGSLFRMYGTLYLPGFAKNHSIKLHGNYQKQYYKVHNTPVLINNERIIYPIDNFLPFGYTYPRGAQPQRYASIATASFDYALPLFYPDLNLGRVAYFMRFRINGFLDYSRFQFLTNQNTEIATRYVSAYGLDIISDMHLAHFVFPFSLGVRLGYETDTNSPFVEFLFGVDIGRF